MSSQSWAGRGWVLPFEKVREFAPAAMAEFEAAIVAYQEEDGYSALRDLEYNDLAVDDPLTHRLERAYAEVKAVVADATGLVISVMAVNDDYDLEDDKLWPAFYCMNVEVTTVPGQMAIDADLVKNTGWVTYG